MTEVISHEIVKKMVPAAKLELLQKRIEHQLTPAEPDPDVAFRENSREFLESQLRTGQLSAN